MSVAAAPDADRGAPRDQQPRTAALWRHALFAANECVACRSVAACGYGRETGCRLSQRNHMGETGWPGLDMAPQVAAICRPGAKRSELRANISYPAPAGRVRALSWRS